MQSSFQEHPLLSQALLLDAEVASSLFVQPGGMVGGREQSVVDASGEAESPAGSPVWKAQGREAGPGPIDETVAQVRSEEGEGRREGEGKQVVGLLRRLEASTASISAGLAWEERYAEIQREWGQLARVVERLLMIVFVVGTVTLLPHHQQSLPPPLFLEPWHMLQALFALLVTVLAVPVPIVSYWSS